ncbi:hypothetical protein N665_0617s0008 [Sinapis alba]|nr:hypothetical protein N665_0617s0008 [Sinapis alba]
MANFNLASLPPSILHKILYKITTTNIQDFGCERVTFFGFNAISRDDYSYRSINLIFMNDWIYEVNVVRTFRLRCMYEFFILHLVDEGWENNCLVGERGCMLAKYVDGMMNLAFRVDDRGLVHKYPGFTRQHVDRMHHLITSWKLSGHWYYDKPGMFMSKCERIDPNVHRAFWCSKIEEIVLKASIDRSRTK